MASSSKAATRLWPGFALHWLNRTARPKDMSVRVLDEYISGIGMIQVNEEQRRMNLPVFQHATIMQVYPRDKRSLYV